MDPGFRRGDGEGGFLRYYGANATKKKMDPCRPHIFRHGTQPGSLCRMRLSLSAEEVEGLPDEVLNELSISEGDKAEFAILGLIDEAGGIISLDKLIVGLWKKTGELHKRQSLISRLYRMGQKDMVFSVPGKKGVYANWPMSEGDIQRLMNEAMMEAEASGWTRTAANSR